MNTASFRFIIIKQTYCTREISQSLPI